MTAVDAARAAILAADPTITETVKWNAPNFVFAGEDRVTMRLPPKGGLQLIFHRGAKVRGDLEHFSFDDPSGLLVWPSPDRGVLTFVDDADVEARADTITELVSRWIAV